MERKSLMRGIDVPDTKADKKAKEKSGDGIPPAKIALVVVCFLIGGAGIAYSAGLFDGKPVHNNKVVSPTGDTLTPEAEKRIEERKKKMELPEGHPQKPVIGAS
ncbi:MAG: hypothetical protein HEQ23_15790 [Tepidisphaera sp.]|jgi:hypothetical protein